MSRSLRIEYPGAIYHVMNRGSCRRAIFANQRDRLVFLQILKETVEQKHIQVHAFSLMDNHYHLLISTPLGNLGRAMQHLDGVYTQRFNKIHKQDGALLRGRYKAILIEKDSYFLEVIRYIHLNRVRAKLVPTARHDANASHHLYLKPENRPA